MAFCVQVYARFDTAGGRDQARSSVLAAISGRDTELVQHDEEPGRSRAAGHGLGVAVWVKDEQTARGLFEEAVSLTRQRSPEALDVAWHHCRHGERDGGPCTVTERTRDGRGGGRARG